MESRLRLSVSESGVTAIDFAIIITAFISMMFGIINIGLILWDLGSMQYAVEAAARCASVDATNCGSASAIQTFALTQYYGESLASNPFTYAATGCGHTVTASYTYSLNLPLVTTYSVPLSATACFP